jgi:MFS transporter, ACS family, tartrate transporter
MTSETPRLSPEPDQAAMSARVIRKVALRVIPFLGLAYFLNYVDRTNIAIAKLTMSQDLGLSEMAYGLASGLFFIGYVLVEVPSNLALNRFGARRWIARILVSWGLIATLMAFVQNPITLYISRILLGIAEAGFFPGILLYLTFWFPRQLRVRITGLFMIALPVSQAVGSVGSSAIVQYLDGLFGLAGWRVLFLVEGLPAVLLGIVGWFLLTDRPRQALWLTESERNWLDATMAAEQESTAAVGHVSVRHSFKDARVWALGAIYFGIAYGLFALSFFLPTIVAGFAKTFNTKFSIFETGMIVAVPFAIATVAMVLWARRSDRKNERIWHLALPMILAAVSIPVALYMNSPTAAMAVITLTAIGVFSSLPVFWYLPSIFLAGPAAAAGIALVNTLGATAGFAAPYVTGWLLDLTGSARAGLWVVGVVILLTAMLLLAMRQRFTAAEADRVAVAPQGH